MNCKYCGFALQPNSGHCSNCGRMIPIDQLQEMKKRNDPAFNQYINENTATYKKDIAYDIKIGKVVIGIIVILFIILIIAIIKGS